MKKLDDHYLTEAAHTVAPIGSKPTLHDIRQRVKQVVAAAFDKGFYDIPSIQELEIERKKLAEHQLTITKNQLTITDLKQAAETKLQTIDALITAIQRWDDWIDGTEPIEHHHQIWELVRANMRKLRPKTK